MLANRRYDQLYSMKTKTKTYLFLVFTITQ